MKKFVYVAALNLFALGCAGLQQGRAAGNLESALSSKSTVPGKNPYNEGWESAYSEHKNLKYKEDDDYVNTFIAAKNCDVQAYNKFKSKALEKEIWGGADCAELEVKSTLLLCSRELEWMFKDRTPEEESLVKEGIETVRYPKPGWPIKDEVLMCEFLAKNSPKDALKAADKIIDKAKKEYGQNYLIQGDNDFIARAMLDKAFILIKTKKDYKTAAKLYNKVYKARQNLDAYISETLEVLRNYLPYKNGAGDKK